MLTGQLDIFGAVEGEEVAVPDSPPGILAMWKDERGRTVWSVQCDQCAAVETGPPILNLTLFYRCAQADGQRRICEPCHEASDCERKEMCRW